MTQSHFKRRNFQKQSSLFSFFPFFSPLSSCKEKMSTNRSFKNEEGSLSDFLWQTPLLFNCHFGEYAKQVILSRCYEELWMNNESIMQQYFFSSKEELLQTIRRQSRPHDGREQSTITDPKSWHSNQILPAEDLSSQKGRQCGHVFRKGEPVYRCRYV